MYVLQCVSVYSVVVIIEEHVSGFGNNKVYCVFENSAFDFLHV